jgi:hypothetical protein
MLVVFFECQCQTSNRQMRYRALAPLALCLFDAALRFFGPYLWKGSTLKSHKAALQSIIRCALVITVKITSASTSSPGFLQRIPTETGTMMSYSARQQGRAILSEIHRRTLPSLQSIQYWQTLPFPGKLSIADTVFLKSKIF